VNRYGYIARIRLIAATLLLASLTVSGTVEGQLPAGFRWVDFKKDPSTVSKVERALSAEAYSGIREIGLADGFALVMTVQRESGQATPNGDRWLVYSVSTKDWKVRALLTGYNLQIKDWINLESRDKQDLGMVYMDCWECEPASLFTALHYDPREGWRARWQNEKDPQHPGIVFLITDVGDPYTNEEVDQVVAVLAPEDGVASVGTWYHSRDPATGKLSDDVVRFSVDPSTGEDRSTVLAGSKATEWKIQLCQATGSWSGPVSGQSSGACKQILNAKRKATK